MEVMTLHSATMQELKQALKAVTTGVVSEGLDLSSLKQL
jgi:hypothetical protein